MVLRICLKPCHVFQQFLVPILRRTKRGGGEDWRNSEAPGASVALSKILNWQQVP